MGESVMYSMVKRIYLNGMIDDYGLDNALKVGWVTEEEYNSIKAAKNPPVEETPEPEPAPEEDQEEETETEPEPPVDEEEPAEEETKENE